jgi:ankyrin repeat protein
LHYCIINNHVPCLTLLLDNQARVDAGYGSILAIHMACLLGKPEALAVLLARGADPDAQGASNCVPLHYAAYSGSVPCLEQLLAKGAFLQCEGLRGETPVLIAALVGNAGAVHFLLGRGAKSTTPSLDGHSLPWTLLCAPEPESRIALSELVKKNKAILAMTMDPYKRTLLHKAVLMLRDEALVEAVKTLLELDIFVDAADELQKTALHYAASLGHVKIVNMLLEQGHASVDAVDCGGNTPLCLALVPVVAEALLAHNANPNHANNQGNTPLHTACAFGVLELRCLLLSWGARAGRRNERSNTPQEIFSLVPPKEWKIQIPVWKKDPFEQESGGLHIEDTARPAPKLTPALSGVMDFLKK